MVLTNEAHIFMWEVRMGSSQGEVGWNRFLWPTGLGYRLRRPRKHLLHLLSGSQLGMLLFPKKILGNDLFIRVTEGGSGVPARIYCLRVQNP